MKFELRMQEDGARVLLLPQNEDERAALQIISRRKREVGMQLNMQKDSAYSQREEVANLVFVITEPSPTPVTPDRAQQLVDRVKSYVDDMRATRKITKSAADQLLSIVEKWDGDGLPF